LKNIRSQWFGQTDVVLERLRRVLLALDRVVIIVDEADTQFGGLGSGVHETERRLTGKVQAMMSDPALLGKVFWLLMTARIHRLSPDLRRPGRVGDLILPVLDPEGDDRAAFARWAVAPALPEPTVAEEAEILRATSGYSAAAFAALRRELAARREGGLAVVRELLGDLLPADLAATRRFQTLQALLNCTRRSLLPGTVDESHRAAWQAELQRLQAGGLE
jgi:SpoVK/Ycf46/Vps4 family AAA+-type ATPase